MKTSTLLILSAAAVMLLWLALFIAVLTLQSLPMVLFAVHGLAVWIWLMWAFWWGFRQ